MKGNKIETNRQLENVQTMDLLEDIFDDFVDRHKLEGVQLPAGTLLKMFLLDPLSMSKLEERDQETANDMLAVGKLWKIVQEA